VVGEAKPTIVVVDDAPEVRTLVRSRLRVSGLLDVVGEAGDGAAAVELVRELRPALVLLDLSMPGVDGLEALPQILETSPGTRVVMYSGFQQDGLAHRALELGASAFLEKGTALDGLADDLVAILAGADAPRRTAAAPVGEDAGERRVLAEHVERFQEVFEDAAIGMATVTLAGQLVRANGSLARLLGSSPDDLVGVPYADIASDAGAQLPRLIDALLTGTMAAARLEHDVVDADGRARRVVATFSPILDSSRTPLYFFVQVQDLTRQRGAEERLRISEQRLRLLVENVEDYAIFMLGTDGTIESWNPGAQRIKGYTADEIIGRHFRTFYPPEMQAIGHPEHELELALRDGHYEEEGWRIRKDGSRFWANVLITTVRDDDGRHVGFAKVTRDHTQRRAQEAALRASEERFRLLVETVQDYAIFMLDPDGTVASWNSGAERTNGYAAEEIIGRHFRTFYPQDVQEARHPEHELAVALAEGRYEEEGWRVRKDGSRFWANVVITTVHDAEGRHVGFAKVTRDVTERRQMLEDQAHFLSITAHELRTPVGVLGGTARMLAEHWADLQEDERAELLEGMTSSAGRLRRLLDDLLTASRLQSSRLELARKTVDVGPVVAECVATAQRSHPDVAITADVSAGLDVDGDAVRLGQVVDNLIGNAVVHGIPPITVTAEGDAERVRVRVQDSGAGVPDAMRSRLFERFSTSRTTGGTGLGLFIVRQLARAHGGDAWYRLPEAGDAGEFVVELPRLGHPPLEGAR
jgi:PAS domain S-box-containing protein